MRPTEVIESAIPGKGYVVNEYREDLVFQISKYDVADFIVSEIVNNNYSGNVVMITS